MFARPLISAICVAVLGMPLCYAATDPIVAAVASDPVAATASHAAIPMDVPEPAWSSSVAMDAPAMAVDTAMGQAASGVAPRVQRTGVKPFSTAAIQLKVGTAGIGLDVAVPVASRFNVRAGGSFFSYNPNLVSDGINIVGNIQLRSGSASLDIFPFGNAFRISPGLVFYNGDNISATTNVPAGNSFTLNHNKYYSSQVSGEAPVTGTYGLSFGNKVAPSLTFGFGNMIPRKGGHWSVPVEIGAEYIGNPPQISLALAGYACVGSATTNCANIATTPAIQANVTAEQTSLNSDIPQGLKYLPIFSIGVSYKFGNSGR